MRMRETIAGLVVVGAVVAAGGQADAATLVKPARGSELDHVEILNSLYGSHGGNFTSGDPSTGFTNGVITVTRIGDDQDQIWSAGTYEAQALASFAALGQVFGTVAGQSGGSFNTLFETVGKGLNATGSANFTMDEDFRFARKSSPLKSNFLTSADADNPQGKDQLVTYLVTGTGLQNPVYLLFWEDLTNGDDDYQDLVLRLTQLDTAVAPAPAALTAGLAMLGAFAFGRKRR